MIRLAKTYLDPDRLQIVVVADKAIPVVEPAGTQTTLEASLKELAMQVGLPFRDIKLR